MVKFRSWNENRNQFYYWQDGYYFKNKECTDDWNMIQVWFNWQNAEQYTGLKDWFVGDKMQGRYDGKILTGVIEYNVKDATFIINCGVNKHGVASYYPLSSSINFKKVSNIHEEEDDKNNI